MRVVFAGTPAAAVPTLERLVDSPHDVVAAISRPDRARGRGRKVEASPVASLARERGITLLQPESARTAEFCEELSQFAPDVCVVVAYGALLPSQVLAIPHHGWINVHFSLLPQWRGAAPVQHALWHGDDITGATTFQLDDGMDTGPIYGTVTTEISSTDTTGSLLDRLADYGADLLLQTLSGIESARIVAVPQSSDGVSVAPKIDPAQARIDWSLPAHVVERRIRACTPTPGAWTMFDDLRLRVSPVQLASELAPIAAGLLVRIDQQLVVGTGSVPVVLGSVTPAGKREMLANDWWRGIHGAHSGRLQ